MLGLAVEVLPQPSVPLQVPSRAPAVPAPRKKPLQEKTQHQPRGKTLLQNRIKATERGRGRDHRPGGRRGRAVEIKRGGLQVLQHVHRL